MPMKFASAFALVLVASAASGQELPPVMSPELLQDTPLPRDLPLPPAEGDRKHPDFAVVPRPAVEKNADALRRLVHERHVTALKESRALMYRVLAGDNVTANQLDGCTRRLLESGREFFPDGPDRVLFLERYLNWCKYFADVQELRYNAGRCNEHELEWCNYLKLDAEVLLLKAKAKK